MRELTRDSAAEQAEKLLQEILRKAPTLTRADAIEYIEEAGGPTYPEEAEARSPEGPWAAPPDGE